MSNASLKAENVALSNEAQRFHGQYFAALEGVRSAQRGIKRLKRKLEVRDAYVAAAERLFRFLEVEHLENGRFATSSLLRDFQESRKNLGLVKKPRPENT